MKQIGLIGLGSFGQFVVKHLKPYFEIVVSSSKSAEEVASFGAKKGTMEEVASKEIVIIAVPVQFFEDVIKEVKNHVKEGAKIVDVSSVKVKPVELMKKYLPENVDIIATHPMFGPQSGKEGIEGLNVVVCPVRGEDLEGVKRFLSDKLKLKVIVKTPEEHDKEMAYVQGLAHFLTRATKEIDIPDSELKTVAYQYLLDMNEMLKNDTMDLFLTLERENPFAKEVRDKFLAKLNELEKQILNE